MSEAKGTERIVTATISKSGGRVKRFVHPARSVMIEMPRWEMQRLRKHLRDNERVVFFDGETEEEVCDFYNVVTPDGRLEPCCRALKGFKESCHMDGAKVALKHKGALVGRETLARLNREAREYRSRVAARRQSAVPRRVVKAECPKCGNVFEVELSGFGNN